MKKILILVVIMAMVLAVSIPADADLELLGQGTSAHGTYNLIYDTDLDITWYDYTMSYDTWDNQVDWADALSVTFGSNTYTDWRLPATVDGPAVWGFDGTTTAGHNITSSEMGHLYFTELGNVGSYDIFGNPTGCSTSPPYCLTNTGDFQNLIANSYWTGTEYSASPSYAWWFITESGVQNSNTPKDVGMYAIAVRDGLVVMPPEPDIKVNSSDDPVIINQGDSLTVSIALNPGSFAGDNADWWIFLFYYNQGTGTFVPVPLASFQSPLFNMGPINLINTTSFPQGTFVFFYGVDMVPNGSFDPAQMYSDLAVVTVQ